MNITLNSIIEGFNNLEVSESNAWHTTIGTTLLLGSALIYAIYKRCIATQLPPCNFGDKCNRNDPNHYKYAWHPKVCAYGSTCTSTKSAHREWFHPQNTTSTLHSTAQVTNQTTKCKFNNQCNSHDPKHYQTMEHPSGPCASGAQCQSDHFGHLTYFDHSPEQRIKGFTKLLGYQDRDCVNYLGIGKNKNMLSHTEFESLYNTTTLLDPSQQPEMFKGTGFSREFLRAAFYHGVRIAAEQLKTIDSIALPLEGSSKSESLADLLKNGKIKFQFGPSQEALKKVLGKLKSSQKTQTIAPFADPKLGEFKWKETQTPQGVQKLDPNQGVHLLTGCYHSTANIYANSIFKEVKMVGGGYLGEGMYFTCSPTKDIGADDLDAVLKTSTYGLAAGGVVVIALVIGHDGVKYVSGCDTTKPSQGNWDLKYLPKGLKGANFGTSSEKNNGGAELVATDSAQVLPLGIIYVEGCNRTPEEKIAHDQLLKTLQFNGQWVCTLH